MGLIPRGSTYTTIRELGPKIPYYRRNYGPQFPNGCICGPSGILLATETSRYPDPKGSQKLNLLVSFWMLPGVWVVLEHESNIILVQS